MVTHLTPDASGRTRCCGRLPSELPLSDGFTVFDKDKTCPHCGYISVPAGSIEEVKLADGVNIWSSIPADSEAKVVSKEPEPVGCGPYSLPDDWPPLTYSTPSPAMIEAMGFGTPAQKPAGDSAAQAACHGLWLDEPLGHNWIPPKQTMTKAEVCEKYSLPAGALDVPSITVEAAKLPSYPFDCIVNGAVTGKHQWEVFEMCCVKCGMSRREFLANCRLPKVVRNNSGALPPKCLGVKNSLDPSPPAPENEGDLNSQPT